MFSYLIFLTAIRVRYNRTLQTSFLKYFFIRYLFEDRWNVEFQIHIAVWTSDHR